jgi:hypothetical protein
LNLPSGFGERVAAQYNGDAKVKVERGLVKIVGVEVSVPCHLNGPVELAAVVLILEVVVVGVYEWPPKSKSGCAHGKEEQASNK